MIHLRDYLNGSCWNFRETRMSAFCPQSSRQIIITAETVGRSSVSVVSGVREAHLMQYVLHHAMHRGREPTLALEQWIWTYWVSSGMRTGWGRHWRPPRRRAAGVTGSGRSVRKTGRRAPSARSGCRLSDCFLETHTHIYRHRRGNNRQASFSCSPTLKRHPARTRLMAVLTEQHLLKWRENKSELMLEF